MQTNQQKKKRQQKKNNSTYDTGSVAVPRTDRHGGAARAVPGAGGGRDEGLLVHGDCLDGAVEGLAGGGGEGALGYGAALGEGDAVSVTKGDVRGNGMKGWCMEGGCFTLLLRKRGRWRRWRGTS